MLAARVYGKEDLRLEDVARPKVDSPTDVIIKVKMVGICGSDNHIYHGENPFVVLPRVMGHEIVGEVVELGSQVADLALGDHVVVEQISYCGKCYACRQGMPNVCSHLEALGVHKDGGMQEYLKITPMQAHKINKDIPWSTAVLAEPYTIAGNSTTRGQVTVGKTLLIQGAGTIGLLTLRMAKAKGATVMITDIDDDKLAFAKANGADEIVNTQKEDLQQRVSAWTDGEMANVIIDAVGLPQTFEQCFNLISVAGAIVPLGMSEKCSQIPQKPIMQKALTIYGSRMQSYQFEPVIKALESGLLGDDGVVNQKFNIKDIQAAFDLMNNQPEQARKIVLTFD